MRSGWRGTTRDQTRPDQTRPGQARPGQARPNQGKLIASVAATGWRFVPTVLVLRRLSHCELLGIHSAARVEDSQEAPSKVDDQAESSGCKRHLSERNQGKTHAAGENLWVHGHGVEGAGSQHGLGLLSLESLRTGSPGQARTGWESSRFQWAGGWAELSSRPLYLDQILCSRLMLVRA